MAPAYPYPGCVVEYLEDNSPRIAMVLEDAGGKLRLLLPGRRETKLAANRILPWIGPPFPASLSKEEAIRILEEKQALREQKSASIPLMDLWEMAQGEIGNAPAEWFAELMETEPDTDTVAAYGRALLRCKTHFRFQPPDFQVYDAATVEKRLAEQKTREEREAIVSQGSAFLHLLWEVASRKRELPATDSPLFPDKALADRIRRLLFARMINPESEDDIALWRLLSRGLPDIPHLPLQLLTAWGLLPKHYNFWLDRADYERGDNWWQSEKSRVEALVAAGADPENLPVCDLPFISIDGASTLDIDDAFFIARKGSGYQLTVALAAPALYWPAGSDLDKMVMRRGTSIYLPEGDLHMMPECLGTDAFSLREGQARPAFCLKMELDEKGECASCEPFAASLRLAANLRYDDVQDAISGSQCSACTFEEQISLAHELAVKREQLRLEQGAVIMLKEEPELVLEKEDGEVKVSLEAVRQNRDAQRLVSEMMILASAALAEWANARNIPLLHRTQNVTVPKEFAGIWERPDDQARVLRALIPSSLEVEARPHAALGLARYAQVTSPLRRYPDLVNEAQILHYLEKGVPRWNMSELDAILDALLPALEGASHVQRFRPRYWKLLYFRQQGDKVWYKGMITEENEAFANVVLPAENIQLRGRRNMFDERAHPGSAVRVRLGKVNPLLNEIQILEAVPEE